MVTWKNKFRKKVNKIPTDSDDFHELSLIQFRLKSIARMTKYYEFISLLEAYVI